MLGTFTLGCDEEGNFTALDCEINFDTGAYASLCGPVLERACTHAVGPYTYQNTDIRGFGYYTNNPPAGAFRGFGVCQSEFALECLVDLLADEVGISPWEIRYKNAIEPGKALPNGQIADCSTALKETLLAVKDVYEKNADHAGLACAMKNSGVGVGLPDAGRANIRVEGGRAVVYSATSDIGDGPSQVCHRERRVLHRGRAGLRHHLGLAPDRHHRRSRARRRLPAARRDARRRARPGRSRGPRVRPR
jgi:aldehyde oxidoreductase